MSNIIGKQVTHKSFGNGVVTEQTEERIVVQFSSGEKKFLYPDAFK